MFATAAPRGIANPEFARAVADGLGTPSGKWISASWLYDDLGSALFEAITMLPEYGLTRADAALLADAAGDIIRIAGRPRLIFELGSGTGAKTRHILEAAAEHGSVEFAPIDISCAALESCAAAMNRLRNVRTIPIEANYLEGIDQALTRRERGEGVLILFLGSTIGNFNPPEARTFLRRVRQRMQPGDAFLLGADLVKPRAKLLGAYDDSLGVTAAFNLNLLARINRELGGEFRLATFRHEARYSERHSRIEMHLRSRIAQRVAIRALDLEIPLARGETIWTESSHKFREEEIRWLGEQAGWQTERQWIDRDWGFAETLFSCPS